MGMLDNIPILRKFVDMATTLLIVIILSVLMGLILAFPVMLLWNFVFGKMLTITVFQAWALNVLCGILFSQRAGKQK